MFSIRSAHWDCKIAVIMKIRSCFDAFICINQIFETGWKIREEKYAMKDANYDSLLALKSVATIKSPYLLRSDEHTSELQSLMRTSYAVFCLHKKTTQW